REAGRLEFRAEDIAPRVRDFGDLLAPLLDPGRAAQLP
ncbi:ATP-dependent DNA ligase, partial [Streptomyces carpinensis]